MSWSQHLRTAQDFLTIGQTVEAVILTLDREERKMSLGIKQLIPDPWITIAEKYPIGSRHSAIVRNFTNFGIFVELEEGVDGLIHISDLSWAKKIKHPAEFTKVGEQIDVVILEMDAENRRLSLGHKQLEDNPWDVFETLYSIGSIHQGTISGQNDKGSVVTLQGVEGFVFNRGLLREDGTTVKNGETEEFKVTEFSKEGKRIVLSHAKIWQDLRDAEREASEEKEKKDTKEISKATKRLSDGIEKSTLGDLDALINLKADLELEENKVVKNTAQTETKAETETETKVEAEAETKAEVETETKAEVETTEMSQDVVQEVSEGKTKKTRAKRVTKKQSSENELALDLDLSPEDNTVTEKPKKRRTKKEDKEDKEINS
jgi:small subunit ribosomal protein S1